MITKELHKYIGDMDDLGAEELCEIADRIEREHEARMRQSREDARRAAMRYLRHVMLDYEKGIKRVRKGTTVEVVRCRDCKWASLLSARPLPIEDWPYVCRLRPLMQHYVKADDYCSKGELKDDEKRVEEE